MTSLTQRPNHKPKSRGPRTTTITVSLDILPEPVHHEAERSTSLSMIMCNSQCASVVRSLVPGVAILDLQISTVLEGLLKKLSSVLS